MGFNYTQHCIFGFKLKVEDLLVELSPEVSENQPRYDTKTGKISHYEKVIIKKAQKVYRFEDIEDDWIPEFVELINEKYPGLSCSYNTDNADFDTPYIYIGCNIGSMNDDWSRHKFLEGEVSIEQLLEMKNKISEYFPDFQDQIKIHFFCWVG